MVAETYNDVATYMQAKNVTLVAKSSGYDVKKEADFVTEKNNNQDAVAEIITKMLNHDYDVVVEKCNE